MFFWTRFISFFFSFHFSCIFSISSSWPFSSNFCFSRELIFQSRHRYCHIPFLGWGISVNEEWQARAWKCFVFLTGLTVLLSFFFGGVVSYQSGIKRLKVVYFYSRSLKGDRQRESLLHCKVGCTTIHASLFTLS